ncbi:hypothetical protein RND71_003539 [Anisodus tanguticus]|uniref:Uncharacterized protein n=1 Tax=Anisodus tanguticus TaxID=243964 RepID=A0AAE1VNT1_9SOLA|nr:hypothetical protein RND71_003539 [Anisodus tanguticus]
MTISTKRLWSPRISSSLSPGYSMISADDLFCKGKLLPLRDNCTKTTTLKDELLVVDDDYNDIFIPRMGKGLMKSWMERLGLNRSHILPRKADKSSGGLDRIDETKTPDFYQYHRS